MRDMADQESNSEIQRSHEFQEPDSNNHEVVVVNKSTGSNVIDITKTYPKVEHKPERPEIWAWYMYELCSYFVHTALLPMVFSLIIGRIVDSPPQPPQGWGMTAEGLTCNGKQLELYERLRRLSITIGNSEVSPLEWISVSWALGLILAFPTLRYVSTRLDHGQSQQLIVGVATGIGALFCLPVGFFRVAWIWPLYIVPIVIALTVATASHTRHHGLMVRGFTGPDLQTHQFPVRRGVSSWLSLYATAAGCLGSAVIAAFVYYMLRIRDIFTGLWVVSIFSGLMWLAGIVHVLTVRPETVISLPLPRDQHFFSIFKHHHGLGSLVVVGLSSFTSMCIFTGGVLYLVGGLCLKPAYLLYFWLIYFIFPSISLPLLQPFQLVLKTNAVKMLVFGLILSLVTTGTGFQFRNDNWRKHHILIFAAVQGTATGALHAFGRVLMMDCSPPGKEGAFATWYSWVKMAGTCLGFAVASGGDAAGNVGTSFGIAFCSAAVAMIVSIYGNISDVGGAVAAGIIDDEGEAAATPPSRPVKELLDHDKSNSISFGDNDDAKKLEQPVAVDEEAAGAAA